MPIWLLSIFTGGLNFLKTIPLKVWVFLIVVLALVLLVWRADSAWNAHLRYVHTIEQRDKDLTSQNTRMNAQVQQLSAVNDQNEAAYQAEVFTATQARLAAEQERQIAEARATRYRSIRDAALKQTAHPVSTTVLSTVNRLWDNSVSPAGNQASIP